jgi:hypothetical protein
MRTRDYPVLSPSHGGQTPIRGGLGAFSGHITG